MALGDSFLDDIVSHPLEHGPRRVYADWLDEHGDPDRAEFIRLQIDRLEAGTPPRARERELLAANEQRWTEPLHGIVQRARFSGGFPETVFVRADTFLKQAGELFRRAPVRHLVFATGQGEWPEVFRCKHLARAETLDLRDQACLDEAGARGLAACPHLKKLRALALRYSLDEGGLGVLATATNLPGLRTLDLYGLGSSWPGLPALLQAPQWAGLSVLSLGDLEECLPAVAPLYLPSCPLRGLAELYLGWCGLSDDLLALLAQAPHLHGLRVLDLTGNQLRTAGGRALRDSPWAGGLRQLHLKGNPLGPRARRLLKDTFGDRLYL